MIDNYGRKITYLRLSVTERCNLRCRYCMPEEGICKKQHSDMLTEDEMVVAAEAAASLGITKVRITGGEPLLKKNILSICRRISEIEDIREVCMTTNGTLLEGMARELRAAGVSRVNISLDTLNPEKAEYMTRRPDALAQTLGGLDDAMKAGFDKIKINTVLAGGFNDDEIAGLAELTVKYPLDVRFIELMPMYDGGDFGEEAFVPGDLVLEKLPSAVPVVTGKEPGAGEETDEVEGSVARMYRLPGALGNIGIISPVSNHFCGACNRLRLTADGHIKTCLHSSDELPVKGLSREEMREQFERAIMSKPACRSPLSTRERSRAGRNMNSIGG